MVKLTFIFNKKILKREGITEDEILKEMREYANENEINETSYGVFEKEGEDAMSLLIIFASELLCKNQKYMLYLKKLELNVDGEKEDCIETTKQWLQKKGQLNKELMR